jgi:hypothetical protein
LKVLVKMFLITPPKAYDDECGDAGDEEAVLDRGRAAIVHLGGDGHRA